MKFLPYSNGVRKVNMKKKRGPKEKIKLIFSSIATILVLGFAVQNIVNFIDKELLRERVDYTTVNNVRMDYRTSGEGNYTVVFDGALGANLEEWTKVVDELKNDGVQTFVYNRKGYGFGNSGERRTPEEQAQDLKILLRKAGVPGPYILVGEDYGSLVLTSFASQFKDSVAGVVLIDPINEETIKTKKYQRSQIINKLRRSIENIGSNFGLTMLLDKLGLDVNITDFEDSLPEQCKNEFLIQRTKSKYTSAVYNELVNLTKGDSNSQVPGVFNDIPYYLLTKNQDDPLRNLGSENLTQVHITKCTKDFLPLNDIENVTNAIRDIIKKVQDN